MILVAFVQAPALDAVSLPRRGRDVVVLRTAAGCLHAKKANCPLRPRPVSFLLAGDTHVRVIVVHPALRVQHPPGLAVPVCLLVLVGPAVGIGDETGPPSILVLSPTGEAHLLRTPVDLLVARPVVCHHPGPCPGGMALSAEIRRLVTAVVLAVAILVAHGTVFLTPGLLVDLLGQISVTGEFSLSLRVHVLAHLLVLVQVLGLGYISSLVQGLRVHTAPGARLHGRHITAGQP